MQLHNMVLSEMGAGHAFPREEKPGTPRKTRVLFLGIGNASRSRMADVWANHLGSAWLEARSVGVETHGENPRAVAAMREAGVDISSRESVRLTPELLEWADLVVTVSQQADESCPALPPGTRRNHWPLNDPTEATGTDEEITWAFRASRDTIRTCVTSLVVELRTREVARRRLIGSEYSPPPGPGHPAVRAG